MLTVAAELQKQAQQKQICSDVLIHHLPGWVEADSHSLSGVPRLKQLLPVDLAMPPEREVFVSVTLRIADSVVVELVRVTLARGLFELSFAYKVNVCPRRLANEKATFSSFGFLFRLADFIRLGQHHLPDLFVVPSYVLSLRCSRDFQQILTSHKLLEVIDMIPANEVASVNVLEMC